MTNAELRGMFSWSIVVAIVVAAAAIAVAIKLGAAIDELKLTRIALERIAEVLAP